MHVYSTPSSFNSHFSPASIILKSTSIISQPQPSTRDHCSRLFRHTNNLPISATIAIATMPSACTYHSRHQTYSCDPKLSTTVLQGAVEHVLESAIASANEYFSHHIMPLYEAYPSLTVFFAIVFGCSVTWRHRWFLVKMSVFVLVAIILHALTEDRAT